MPLCDSEPPAPRVFPTELLSLFGVIAPPGPVTHAGDLRTRKQTDLPHHPEIIPRRPPAPPLFDHPDPEKMPEGGLEINRSIAVWVVRLCGVGAPRRALSAVMRFVVYEPTRLGLAYDSLAGLSVGDALGAQFFMVGRSLDDLVAGRPPAGPWEWTDDTHMACSVAGELRDHSGIDQDRLAAAFAQRCEPNRGYGAGAVVILYEIRDGVSWRQAAGAAFGGQGSCGNGAAMRVAPLGAYHLDRPDVS
jgi:hypothetical protein